MAYRTTMGRTCSLVFDESPLSTITIAITTITPSHYILMREACTSKTLHKSKQTPPDPRRGTLPTTNRYLVAQQTATCLAVPVLDLGSAVAQILWGRSTVSIDSQLRCEPPRRPNVSY